MMGENYWEKSLSNRLYGAWGGYSLGTLTISPGNQHDLGDIVGVVVWDYGKEREKGRDNGKLYI